MSASASLRTFPPLGVVAVLATSTADHPPRYSGSRSAPSNVADLDPSSAWASAQTLCTSAVGCWENVTLDLGAVRAVGAARVRVGYRYEGGFSNAEIEENHLAWSADGHQWNTIASISGGPTRTQTRAGIEEDVAGGGGGVVQARFVRFSQLKRANDLPKLVVVRDFYVWGASGPFGALPPVTAAPSGATAAAVTAQPLRALLGINSIWGFFTDRYSHTHRAGWGPHRFSRMATHGRNYHNVRLRHAWSRAKR